MLEDADQPGLELGAVAEGLEWSYGWTPAAAQRLYEKVFRTTEQLLKHANQAFSLAEARYKIGSSSIVELTDAQVNATSAQIADANARYGELIQRAILDYQTGVLR